MVIIRQSWSWFLGRLTAKKIALFLLIAGGVIGVSGTINQHCPCVGLTDIGNPWNKIIGDFYANIAWDCWSIAFAILVIDELYDRRVERELQESLLRQMASRDHTTAINASNELRAYNWQRNGLLRGVNLTGANLKGLDLPNADFEGATLVGSNLENAYLPFINLSSADLGDTILSKADLSDANLASAKFSVTDLSRAILDRANLQDTDLTNAKLDKVVLREANLRNTMQLERFKHSPGESDTYLQVMLMLVSNYHLTLARVSELRGAIMHDGSRYDGRYRLPGDLLGATFFQGKNGDNPEEMAQYYGVSLREYLEGQEWLTKVFMPLCGSRIKLEEQWDLKVLEWFQEQGLLIDQKWVHELIDELRLTIQADQPQVTERLLIDRRGRRYWSSGLSHRVQS